MSKLQALVRSTYSDCQLSRYLHQSADDNDRLLLKNWQRFSKADILRELAFIPIPGMAATLDTIAEQPGVEAARAESLHQAILSLVSNQSNTPFISFLQFWSMRWSLQYRQPPHSSLLPGQWLNFSQVCTHYTGASSEYLVWQRQQ